MNNFCVLRVGIMCNASVHFKKVFFFGQWMKLIGLKFRLFEILTLVLHFKCNPWAAVHLTNLKIVSLLNWNIISLRKNVCHMK